ncbi:MAG: extracellular ligand-binding receptor [Magnetococcales bacterium]|nr:extracellular ligand-binding receptor [Magnetococcales bacterium]
MSRLSPWLLVCLPAMLLLLVSCSDQQANTGASSGMPEASSGMPEVSPGSKIAIGVVWNENWNKDDLVFQGAELAQEEINKAGGVLGHPLEIIPMHDLGTDTSLGAITVARAMVAIPNLVGVVGHSVSASAIPASVTYENNGIVFVSISSTQLELTNHNFNFIFRTIPNNTIEGLKMAQHAKDKGYKNIAVLYSFTANNEQVARIFMEKSVSLHNANIVYNKMYSKKSKNFSIILSEIKSLLDKTSLTTVDAIFFSGRAEQGGIFIQQARKMGINIPIMGSDGLDSPVLWTHSRETAAGTVVPSVFNKKNTDEKYLKFSRDFKYKFGQDSTTLSAMAYDAIGLLAHAIHDGESYVPFEIATTLRFLPKAWRGVTGCHHFTMTGDIVGKEMYIQEMQKDGTFMTLPGPLSLDACE